MIIKVCGMREPDNIRAVAEAGPDWMGMIFWKKSSRYVGMTSTGAGTIPDLASPAAEAIPEGIKRVGVFVDEMPQTIITKIVKFRLDMIQLHGNESPTLIRNLRATVIPDIKADLEIIKAISVSGKDDILKYKDYTDCVDYFLFDTKCQTVGGSGRQFDWSVLECYDGELPFILSGGIAPGDEERLKAFHHDRMIGIDINSRFEIQPGLKDADAVRTFIRNIRI